MTVNKKIEYRILVFYIILGFLVNVISVAVFGVSNYLNPKTYRGNEGHNNGLVVLIIYIPLWTYLIYRAYKSKDRYALISYGINATLCLIFYTIIALTE